MTKLIGAPTLDSALSALSETVATCEARGERTLVFCEDRLTLLAERAVLRGRGGTFLTEVSTFRRFLQGRAQKTVSKQGSVLIVAALLEELGGELHCFKKRAAQAVYETIAQLAASRVDAALLRTGAEETGGMLKEKLLDLALLLEKYEEFLRERGLLDENGYLALLPAAIREELRGVHVVFFAFPSFTRQAREGIRAAFTAAGSVTGIFLAGREEFYTDEGARIFRETAAEAGESLREIRMPSDLTGDAALFSSALFAVDAPRDQKETTHVRNIRAQDEVEELETIAAHIQKFAKEGRRYREIAVLVGGEGYFPVVEQVFRAHRIPYYADVKRKFSEHPFCTFALDVLNAVADGVLPAEADAIAASPYFGDRASGNYRNYLLRYCGYRGGAWREIRGDVPGDYGDPALLQGCRERMLAILGCFREVKRKPVEGRVFTAGVRALRVCANEEQTTASIKRELAESTEKESGAWLSCESLESVLCEIDALVGDRLFTAREFSNLFRSALEALTVSVLPQRADAVFVGDITESRMGRTPVLFCAGLTDALPRVVQDTAVITDGELRQLSRLEVEIDPAIAVVNARAREALALNLLSFGEELILSCPACVDRAEAVRSEVFDFAEKTFKVLPMPEVYPFDRTQFGPALMAFFRDAEREFSGENAAEYQARYSALRELFLSPPQPDWPSVDPEQLFAHGQKEDAAEAGALWTGRELSPTALEDYFLCPYKGFMMRALRLSEREERSLLDASDAGTFVHTVLERVARDFNAISSEEECRARAREEAERLIGEPQYAAIRDTAAGEYAHSRLVGEAESVTAVAYRQLLSSAYRVREAEKEIALPALHLRGKADRVDEAGDFVRVIDYKTGEIADDVLSYYTGRKLQLELYLRAVSEGHVAAGAFYFPAADDFVSEQDGENPFRMKGFYCKDEAVVKGLDTVCNEGKSEIFESGSRKALPREEFEHFLDYGVLVAEKAKEELSAGHFAPSPYEKACGYCKLKGLCGFTGDARKEERMTAQEVAAIAKKAGEDGHGEG